MAAHSGQSYADTGNRRPSPSTVDEAAIAAVIQQQQLQTTNCRPMFTIGSKRQLIAILAVCLIAIGTTPVATVIATNHIWNVSNRAVATVRDEGTTQKSQIDTAAATGKAAIRTQMDTAAMELQEISTAATDALDQAKQNAETAADAGKAAIQTKKDNATMELAKTRADATDALDQAKQNAETAVQEKLTAAVAEITEQQ